MNFSIQTLALEALPTQKCDALILLLAALPKVSKAVAKATARKMPKPLDALLDKALQAGDFDGEVGAFISSYAPAGWLARQVVIVSVGEGNAKNIKAAVMRGYGALKTANLTSLVLHLGDIGHEAVAAVAMQAVADAAYVYTSTKPSAKAGKLSKVTVAVTDAKASASAFAQGQALVVGAALMREWANRPANHATPTLLADAALALAKASQDAVHCEVLGPKAMASLKMGALLAVSRGSAEEPRLIVLRYSAGPKSQAPVVLVGKGVTFDSGGISLKPAAGMDQMKFDMTGAAAVLGVFAALAKSRFKGNVVGVIAACENLPSGSATKPGDVVRAMDGQTIEVLNTDAEGRLILCDAITYARRFKPAVVVDVATLTGACGVALGAVRAGLFANDDALAHSLMAAGEQVDDRCWRLPLDEDYAEGLASNFADMANVSDRQAGAVTAAKFLQKFTQGLTWAHLDIAGVAWRDGKQKGVTTRPLALLLQWLQARDDAN